jgi:hypothetical protein
MSFPTTHQEVKQHNIPLLEMRKKFNKAQSNMSASFCYKTAQKRMWISHRLHRLQMLSQSLKKDRWIGASSLVTSKRSTKKRYTEESGVVTVSRNQSYATMPRKISCGWDKCVRWLSFRTSSSRKSVKLFLNEMFYQRLSTNKLIWKTISS